MQNNEDKLNFREPTLYNLRHFSRNWESIVEKKNRQFEKEFTLNQRISPIDKRTVLVSHNAYITMTYGAHDNKGNPIGT